MRPLPSVQQIRARDLARDRRLGARRPAFVGRHNREEAMARRRERAEKPGPPPAAPPVDPAARRAAKPSVPLGTPHCPPCLEAEAERKRHPPSDPTGSDGGNDQAG